MEIVNVKDDDFSTRLEFNKLWWGAAQEGEPLAESEITEVKWLIQQIERLNEGWEVMTQMPMDMHPGEVRAFAKKMVKGEAPFRLNEPMEGR